MQISRVLPLLLLLASCALQRPGIPSSLQAEEADPSKAEVPLPAEAADWRATLVLDNGKTGIWTVKAFPVFRQFAALEVVGCDDLGRLHVLVGYSGKWTPFRPVHDSKWLGGLAHGDVDPRVPGAELYTGSQRGNVYQVVPYPHTALDARLIAHLDGREIHTLLAGDLDAAHPGPEVLVFTRPGALYRLTPTGPDGRFETTLVQELPGRVRDAVVLPGGQPGPPGIATVSRDGRLALLRLTADGPAWTVLHQETAGLGRIALRPAPPRTLYVTVDDGRLLRFQERPDGTWEHETIYTGPQGPRGVAAGRFSADRDAETVVLFGYDREVRLLTRKRQGWRAETLFVDRDKGHWLAAAELDGRNGTDELLASGYGGRIVLLARPPGYALPAEVARAAGGTPPRPR